MVASRASNGPSTILEEGHHPAPPPLLHNLQVGNESSLVGPPQPSWRRRVSNSMRQTLPSQSDRSPEKKHPIASAASPDPSSSKAVSELVEEVKASRDAMRLATEQLNLLLERADGLLKSTSRTNQEERGLDA